MLVVSDSIKEAYNKYTTQRKSYIKSGNNSFFIQNLDISADCYEEGNVVGNAISKIAKFDIETEVVSGLNEFEIFDGIWTGSEYEYVSLGTFKLFNEEGTDDFFSSITAYDKLINFNKEYDPSLVSFPINLYDFLKAICGQASVELENIEIANGNQILDSNPFVEKETLKQILKALCQINGCFGIISQDKLKLMLKGTNTLQLDKYQISNPEYKRTTWKINQVVLGMADVEGEYVLRQDSDDIAENGVHKLVINDNPFVYTQELREAYIDNLFNQLKGFGYIAFETEWEGISYVELGDLLNIDGRESIVLRYNLKSPNGLKSTLSAPSIIESVIGYVDNSNSISNRQKKTEISVDKQNQKINAVVETQENQESTLAELEIEAGTISQRVQDAQTSIDEINGALTTIESTFLEQTSENFTMWFEQTGVQGTIDDLKNLVNNQNTTLDQLRAYIRYDVITDIESEFYGSPYIELGKEDAQTKLRILDNRIQFLTGETQTAYISNNALYINESTILTKQVIGKSGIGKWITEIDEQGNLNTYWGGTD